MAAWLGRSVDWLVLPERPSAPRRGDFQQRDVEGRRVAGARGGGRQGAGRRSTSSAGSQPVTGSWLWA